MQNRYQEFLRNTLWVGLKELQKNPSAAEVAGISLGSFDLLIQAFRSGLSEDLKISLSHNLANPEYVQILLNKIDFLLSPGIPEAATQENIKNLTEIVGLYQEHREAEKAAKEFADGRAGWQNKFEQSIAAYHQGLLNNLHQEIIEACPSLTNKPEIVEIIGRDVARTIQDQVLPAINFDYETRKTIREVTEKALKTYASEVGEIKTNQDLVSQMAQKVAQKTEQATWEVRVLQKNAILVSPTQQIEIELRRALAAGLPYEAYQNNPEIVKEISRRIMARLSLPYLAASENYPQDLAKEISLIVSSPEIQKVLGSFSEETRQKIQELPGEVSTRVTPVAQKWSQSPQATMAGGAAMPIPPPSLLRGLPGLPPEAPDFQGRFDMAWDLSHPTDFLFFGLSQPSLKTLPTSLVGLGLDFLGVFPPLQNKMLLSYLAMDQAKLQGAIKYYEGMAQEKAIKEPNTKGQAAYQNMADFLKAIQTFNQHLPTPIAWPVKLYANIQSLNLRLASKTGISFFQLLEYTSKYGGPGFNAVIENGLKITASRLVGAGLFASLPSLFDYDELEQEVYFKYGPKALTKWVRGKIFEFGKKTFGAGVKSVATKILTKLGLSALLGTLSGGASLVIQGALYLLKKLWKWIVGIFGVLFLWLIAQLGAIGGTLAFLGSMALGGFIGSFLGPWGTVIGVVAGPIVFSGLTAFVKSALFPSGTTVSAAGLGTGGLGTAITLTPYTTPVLTLAGGTVVGGTVFTMMVLSSAFFIPGEEKIFGSRNIEIIKELGIEGYSQETKNFPNGIIAENKAANYRITVTAKNKTLNNLQVEDVLILINKNGSSEIKRQLWDKNNDIKLGELKQEEEWQTTYQISLGQEKFKDSIVSNTVTVKADEGEEKSLTLVFSIGSPPSGCFQFAGGWTAEEKTLETQAVVKMTASSQFSSLLCQSGPIILERFRGSHRADCDGCGGRFVDASKLIIYDEGLISFKNALYTLAHESGHIVSARSLPVRSAFVNERPYDSPEYFLPTYPFASSAGEDFAEMIADYVVYKDHLFPKRTWSGFEGEFTDFPIKYPKHYNFAKNRIFGGYEY